MENHLISIIIPVYNVEPFLEKCIFSVKTACERLLSEKTIKSEIILIDDGCFDSSAGVCDEIATNIKTKGCSVKIVHQHNAGLSVARNMGLALANGDIISFVDSDDYIHEDMYLALSSAIYENNCDIAVCNYTVDESNFGKCTENKPQIFEPQQAILSCINDGEIRDVVWNKIYKKEVLVGLQFPPNKMSEDVYFTYRALSNASKIIKKNNNYYFYRTRKGSIMQVPFSPKWLDALDAKIMRHNFIKQKMPEITDDSAMNIIYTCIYDGQCAYKYLEKEQRKTVLRKLSKIISKYEIPKQYMKSLRMKSKIWLTLAKINLSFSSFLRSRLNVGF